MDLAIKYRGKSFKTEDISFIKGLIAENPNDSRFALSKKLCKEWNWVQTNGTLKDMVCRGFMLQLHREGHIQLPARKRPPLNPLRKRNKPEVVRIQQKPLIGWSPDVRMRNLPLIAYNTRFLILPWVRVKNLASHILGQMVRVLPRDWQNQYHHPVYYLETFVDKSLFSGGCYNAANWIYLGDTTGRGKNDQTNKPNRTIKAIWGLPLSKHFRERLCNAQA